MKIKLIHQQFFWVIIFTVALIIFPLTSLALTPQQVPNPQQNYGGWVTDMADILTEDTEAKLNQQISALQAKNGTEIAIVTVPETKPSATPKQFTTELFNYWGIGKEGIDNGVLFLVSTGDRRVEIETGYGVEGILPDAKVGNIIDTKIIPQFKQDNFEQGILDGTNALIQVLENEQIIINKNTPQTQKSSPIIYIITIIVVLASFFALFILLVRSSNGTGSSGSGYGGGSHGGGYSGGGGSHGGGYSGGGGSFGGGSSGGGGAGGDF